MNCTNSATSGGFGGGGLGTALGTSTTECQGTGSTPFQAYQEKEGTGPVTNYFQSLSFMPPYKNFSFEVSIEICIYTIALPNQCRNSD